VKGPGNQFGIEGFLVLLVGCRVPYRAIHTPSDAEWRIVNQHRAAVKQQALAGFTVKEALAQVKNPHWVFPGPSR
jgi:tryptophan halogenase